MPTTVNVEAALAVEDAGVSRPLSTLDLGVDRTGAATAVRQDTLLAAVTALESAVGQLARLVDTQPVSGPLTNTELRAVPLPVSGTVATGGLTDFATVATGAPSVLKRVGKPLSAIAVGQAATVLKRVGKPLAVAGAGVPSIRRAITKAPFMLTAIGVPGFARALIAARSFAASAAGVVRARVDMDVSVLSRITGGGTTIAKKAITYIFDD